MTYSDTSTQSIEDRLLGSGSSAPTLNSRGEQVWNPAVGIYHKPAAVEAESFGGIIGSLEDAISKIKGVSTKDYPENFAGIIAAIQDLAISAQDTPGSDIGTKPPHLEIIIDPDTGLPDYVYPIPPENGELWFDTRQGRLFVWVEDDWYQTNGADGLPIVTDTGLAPEVEHLIPGQTWWDALNNDLYIWDGSYVDTGGRATRDQAIWKLVGGEDSEAFQTTLTLPLGNVGPRLAEDINTTSLPEVDPALFNVQADYNNWVYLALTALDNDIENLPPPTFVGEAPPPEDEREPGMLWYDTAALELSIWYVEEDGTAAWVPTSTPYAFDDSLAVVTAAVQDEARTREYQFHQLQEALNNVNTAQDVDISGLEADLAALQQTVDTLPIPSIAGLVGKEYVDNIQDSLETSINEIEESIKELVSKTYVDSALEPLIIAEASHVTKNELAAVRAEIPSLAGYATTGDVTQALASFNNRFLPRNGGFLTDGLSWNSPYNARNALSFATYSPSLDVDSTFGTTDNYYELAWSFQSEEDFCWVHNTNGKVFSVTKDGPACKELLLGDFSTNDANGRVISNTIGVKAKLDQYQLAFQSIVAAAHSATTFDDFKGHLINTLSGY